MKLKNIYNDIIDPVLDYLEKGFIVFMIIVIIMFVVFGQRFSYQEVCVQLSH